MSSKCFGEIILVNSRGGGGGEFYYSQYTNGETEAFKEFTVYREMRIIADML